MAQAAGSHVLVEVLGFEGCPNTEPTRETVERLVAELGVEAEVHSVDVPDPDTAERLRFLGSPSVHVNGRDVEPGADERGEFSLGCRVYRTNAGASGEPREQWIRDALTRAVTTST